MRQKRNLFRTSFLPAKRGISSFFYEISEDFTLDQGLADNEQTWEYDGGAWELRDTNRFDSRTAAALAYDAARGVTVLHGDAWSIQEETEVWDGQSWTIVSNNGPWRVDSQGMVYDSRREVTVLFGGYFDPGARDTTWEWDGQAWTQRSFAPLGRYLAEMVYDAARGHTVLFGGDRVPASDDDEYTFAWDGRQWSILSTLGPGGGGNSTHAMIYNTRLELTVSFASNQTWYWDGAEWTWVTDMGPSRRKYHAMSYDRARDMVVLFGGDALGPNQALNSARLPRWCHRCGSAQMERGGRAVA